MRPLGFAYLVALAASLVVALTITPALCSLLLLRSKAVLQDREAWLVRMVKRLYGPVLRLALEHPWFFITPVWVAQLDVSQYACSACTVSPPSPGLKRMS